MGIGAVGRNAQIIESVDGLDKVQAFGDENEIGTQGDDLLKTWIDRAAHFGFFLSLGGIIAVIGISDEAILQRQGRTQFL